MSSQVLPSENFKKLIKKIRVVLRCVGADCINPNYKPNRITFLMYCIVPIYLSFLGYTMRIKFREDWKTILESLCVIGTLAQVIAKLTMAVVYSKTLYPVFQILENIYVKFEKTERYKNILSESFEKSKIAMILNLLVYLLAMCMMWFCPLYYYFFRGQKIFPMNLLIPGVSIETTGGYFFTYVIQVICVFVGGFGNLAADAGFILLAMSMTLLKDIFRQKILDFNNELQGNNNKQQNNLRDIVNWLNIYYEFSDKIISSFFAVTSVEIFSCAFGATVSIFIIMVGDWPPAYPAAVVNMVSLYIFCIVGTICENSADEIIDNIYEIDWYLLKVTDQKVVHIMLTRSQQKVLFTVAHVAPLSVNTALQVTKAIYSYWMMLMNFVE